MATFEEPVVFAVSASFPIATFWSPVVIASKAVVPNEKLYCAVEVVEDGSCPRYMELVSTKASDRPSMLVDAVLLAQDSAPLPSVFKT